MFDLPKIDNQPLTDIVRKILLQKMKEGAFASSSRLPSEAKLAENLGVSRSVIRDVLALFETKGFITRRRGIGTVINHHVLNVATRLDLEQEFLDLIAARGYTPRISYVNVYDRRADQKACHHLKLKIGEDIYAVERLVLADGIPAIYCIDSFSKKLIVEKDYDESELKAPIFQFLKKRCHLSIINDLTEIIPICVDEHLSRIMDIPVGKPILHLDEVGYDIEQEPVLWSQEYHRADLLHYTLLRSKI